MELRINRVRIKCSWPVLCNLHSSLYQDSLWFITYTILPYRRVSKRILTVILIQTYHVFLSEASSMSSYELRKKETAMKNIVRRNDVFDTQHLEESLKISKNYKNYGTSDRDKKIKLDKNHQNHWEQKISSQKWKWWNTWFNWAGHRKFQ